MTKPLPHKVVATFKNTNMKVNVPKPFTHLLLLTIRAGPVRRNFAMPNEAAATERLNVK